MLPRPCPVANQSAVPDLAKKTDHPNLHRYTVCTWNMDLRQAILGPFVHGLRERRIRMDDSKKFQTTKVRHVEAASVSPSRFSYRWLPHALLSQSESSTKRCSFGMPTQDDLINGQKRKQHVKSTLIHSTRISISLAQRINTPIEICS